MHGTLPRALPRAIVDALDGARRGDLPGLVRLERAAVEAGLSTADLGALMEQRQINARPINEFGVWLKRATWSQTGVATLWCIACQHRVPDDDVFAMAAARGLHVLDFAPLHEKRALHEIPPEALHQLRTHVHVASAFVEEWDTVARLAGKLHVSDGDVEQLARQESPHAAGVWRKHAAQRKTLTRKAEDPLLVDVSAVDAVRLWKAGGAGALAGLSVSALEELRSAVDAVWKTGGGVADVEGALTSAHLPLADRILALLVDAGASGLRKGEIIDAFNRNVSATRLNAALAKLVDRGAAAMTREPTPGRFIERWRALQVPNEKRGNAAQQGTAPFFAGGDTGRARALPAQAGGASPPMPQQDVGPTLAPESLPGQPPQPATVVQRAAILGLLRARFPEANCAPSTPTSHAKALLALIRARHGLTTCHPPCHTPRQGAPGLDSCASWVVHVPPTLTRR